jgi:hypothetical protein
MPKPKKPARRTAKKQATPAKGKVDPFASMTTREAEALLDLAYGEPTLRIGGMPVLADPKMKQGHAVAFFGLDRTKKVERKPIHERILAIFDLHLPEHDPVFWAVTLAYVEATKPDRILLVGDIADSEWASRHGGNPTPPKAKEELKPVRRGLEQLRKAAGDDCAIDYFQGNHEERIEKYIIENAPALHGLDCLTLPELLDFDSLKINWIKTDMQPARYGDALVLHGHQIKGGGQFPAKQLTEVFGAPGLIILCGHYHRDQVYVKVMHPKPCKGMVVGCGRTLNPKWLGGPSSWHHSLARIDVYEDVTKVRTLDASGGIIIDGDNVYRA